MLKSHMHYLGLQPEDTKHLMGSFKRMCAACVLPKQAGLSILQEFHDRKYDCTADIAFLFQVYLRD